MNHYVGIDPSTETGLVILDNNGNVVLERIIKSNIEDKIEKAMYITEVLMKNIFKHDNVIINIEGFSYGSKGKGVDFQYGLGYLIRCNIKYDLSIYIETPPKSLKKYVTGNGNASKDMMMKYAFKRWGYDNDDNNLVDAYCLARMIYEENNNFL